VNTNKYVLRKVKDNVIELSTNCGTGTGTVKLTQEELSVELEMTVDKNCETLKTDERFIADINNVINISVEESHVSLRLHNNNGVMHFEEIGQQKTGQ
jgi:DNA replication protein DnaD